MIQNKEMKTPQKKPPRWRFMAKAALDVLITLIQIYEIAKFVLENLT